ncbi:MAG: sensor histidine kinase [Algibacter sp.]
MNLKKVNLKAKTVLVCLLILSICSLYAQEPSIKLKIKTLERKINQAKGGHKLKLLDSLNNLALYKPEYQYDSIARATIACALKLDSLNIVGECTSRLIYYYANRTEEPEKGLKLFISFKKQILKINDNTLLANLYINGGDSHVYTGALNTAISLYNKAEEFALKAEDSVLYANSRSYKGSVLGDMGEYAKGSRMLSEAAKILRNKKDTLGLVAARNSLSVLYSKMGFFKEAKRERDEVINLLLLIKDYLGLQSDVYNASIDADKIGDQKLRIALLKRAYDYGMKSNEGFPLKPIINYDLLGAYADNDSLVKAKMYYENIQKEYATKNPIPYEDIYRSALADYFFATNDFNKALIEAQKALNILIDANHAEGIHETYNRLSRIYKGLNDFENAYVFSMKYVKFKDSINSIQKATALSYYQTLYETEKRDFKIADQEAEIFLLDSENKLNRQWMLFGGAGLLLLFLIAYLLRSRRFICAKQELQERFSQDLINQQEKERIYLSRELHDSVGQKLMLLSKTVKKLGSTKAERLANSSLEEIRYISRGLHPSNLERLGLTMAINAMIYEINASTDLFFSEVIEYIDGNLSKKSELHLFRIIQETLNNIVKHSEAKSVKINIQKAKQTIEVFISDNGKGFNMNRQQTEGMSLGMKTIEERAKIINTNLRIESNLGKGTVMTLSIPMQT